ncbi:hypothetical protein Nmel_015266 [Mimus melanotis]
MLTAQWQLLCLTACFPTAAGADKCKVTLPATAAEKLLVLFIYSSYLQLLF